VRDKEIAVDIVALVVDDSVDVREFLLLQLSNSKGLDLSKAPTMGEGEDDRPVVDLGIV
jgi:hypothetical protein